MDQDRPFMVEALSLPAVLFLTHGLGASLLTSPRRSGMASLPGKAEEFCRGGR
jgi:hypothetical protein